MNRLGGYLGRHTPWLVAAVIVLVNLASVRAFREVDYWAELSHQCFAPAALALALTPIILTGGIDLSVGSVSVFVAVVIGMLWHDLGWPIGCALAGGVCAGAAAGAGNGLLVCGGIVPLVATLATRELFRGLALTLSGDTPVSQFPPALHEFWRTPVAGLPVPFLVLAFLFVLTYLMVHHTWIGRMLFALGDNEQAARFAGVPVRRLKVGLYVWSGLVAALCGLASVLEYGDAKANADKSLELAAIAGVVLGGVRITGGAGHVAGALVGMVTLAMLVGGLQGTAPEWRETITGGLVVGVAMLNEVAARRMMRRQGQEARPGLAKSR